MSTLFAYPNAAAFGRVLPKNKIYEHGRPSSAVKQLFVQQVEQIVWQYKLAPETIHLNATRSVPEIQVFTITLKEGVLKEGVLRCIDNAIPFPIIFELHFEGKVKPIAAYKRPSEASSEKWTTGEYFDGDWVDEETTQETNREALPVVMDLGGLYKKLLSPLMPHPAHPDEGLRGLVERMERIKIKQRELERCESRLRKEKQFNHKVAINAELRKLKQEIRQLIAERREITTDTLKHK